MKQHLWTVVWIIILFIIIPAVFSTKTVTYGVLIIVFGYMPWLIIRHKIVTRKMKKKAEADAVDRISTESDN